MKKRRNHDAGFEARAALEAVKGKRTVSELVAEYGLLAILCAPLHCTVWLACWNVSR